MTTEQDLSSAVLRGLKVVVVDYESGNLRSVAKALERAGVCPVVSGDPAELSNADAVVLPGVGAAGSAMKTLHRRGLIDPLRGFIESGKPFLGLCLGLQLLMERAEEGDVACLGVAPGRARRLPSNLKVPHMGWNLVEFTGSHPALREMPPKGYFYFVHSYYVDPEDAGLAVGFTEYGLRFCSVLAKGGLLATQFHPEKSGPLGLKLYRGFARHAAALAGGG